MLRIRPCCSPRSPSLRSCRPRADDPMRRAKAFMDAMAAVPQPADARWCRRHAGLARVRAVSVPAGGPTATGSWNRHPAAASRRSRCCCRPGTSLRSWLDKPTGPVTRSLGRTGSHAWRSGARGSFRLTVRQAADAQTALRCHALAARIALGKTTAWSTTSRRSGLRRRACRRLATRPSNGGRHAAGRGCIDERRARLALSAGDAGLARFLARSLPEKTAAPLQQWLH